MDAARSAAGAARFEAGTVYVRDRACIEVALEARQRYKYVLPRVLPQSGLPGWRVVSPNCSRSVDPAGGDIDIAWLEPAAGAGWRLHARDHRCQAWVLKLQAPTLAAALARLVDDPLKEFWQ
jgi:hypothetical protein